MTRVSVDWAMAVLLVAAVLAIPWLMGWLAVVLS